MAMCLLARDVYYYLELGVSSINSNELQGRDVRIGTEQLFRGCRYVCPRSQDVCGVEESDPAVLFPGDGLYLDGGVDVFTRDTAYHSHRNIASAGPRLLWALNYGLFAPRCRQLCFGASIPGTECLERLECLAGRAWGGLGAWLAASTVVLEMRGRSTPTPCREAGGTCRYVPVGGEANINSARSSKKYYNILLLRLTLCWQIWEQERVRSRFRCTYMGQHLALKRVGVGESARYYIDLGIGHNNNH